MIYESEIIKKANSLRNEWLNYEIEFSELIAGLIEIGVDEYDSEIMAKEGTDDFEEQDEEPFNSWMERIYH